MIAPAAESTIASPEVAQAVTRLREEWARLMSAEPLIVAIIMVVAGVVFLLYGFRLYKALVMVLYAFIGLVVGGIVAAHFGIGSLWGAIPGALLLGLVAWPLHRLGWGILGGLAFAAAAVIVPGIFAAVFSGLLGLGMDVWVLLMGLAGFIVGLVLTMLILRPLIIVITSLCGGSILVQGAMQLVAQWPATGGKMVPFLVSHVWVQVVLVLLLAGIGVVLQFTGGGGARSKPKPRKKDEEAEE